MLLINNNQTIRQKKIQIQFLTGEPDSTLKMIEKDLDYLFEYFNSDKVNKFYDQYVQPIKRN